MTEALPMTEALLTRCRRLADQNTFSFAEIIHTLFQSTRRVRDCVQALMMKFSPCCRRRGQGQIGEQIRQKKNWVMIALQVSAKITEIEAG